MFIRTRNVNSAFTHLIETIRGGSVSILQEKTRNGTVLSFEDPVTIQYHNPLERVLFNPGRDCNPFFHVIESLWMLNGRDTLKELEFFTPNMRNYSDDGETLWGAYGHRWRLQFTTTGVSTIPDGLDDQIVSSMKEQNAPQDLIDDMENGKVGMLRSMPIDQIELLIEIIKNDNNTRRAVLAMWDPSADLMLLYDSPQCRDLPCNTHIYFRVIDGYLNMTVCNRSNDLIWGSLGANAVHMSFLLEYMAIRCGLNVGVYNQFSNNLHLYCAKWDLTDFQQDETDFYAVPDNAGIICIGGGVPIITSQESAKTFHQEVDDLLDLCTDTSQVCNLTFLNQFISPFLNQVAAPMVSAFHYHKKREYKNAISSASLIKAQDWKHVTLQWLRKRESLYERRTDPNYDNS